MINHICANMLHTDMCVFVNGIITESNQSLLIPPNINTIDWKMIIVKMLKKEDISFFHDIECDSTILVNIVKNNTNGILNINKITNILMQCISENVPHCNVINMEQLNFAYREIGISPEDYGNAYYVAVKVAHHLKADYVLYGIVYGYLEQPKIELQLIFVKTGEIINVISNNEG